MRLESQPVSYVVGSVSKLSDPDGVIDSQAPTTLVYTTANWDTPQSVQVLTFEDANTTNSSGTIRLTAIGLAPCDVAITVHDLGTQEIVVSPTSLTIPEGGSGMLDVHLNAEPAADVQVAIVVTGDSDVSRDLATLTFTPGNWATAQTVTVSAAKDPDGADDLATI